MSLLNRKGSISFKTLLFTAVVLAAGYVGYKMAPVFFANLMFKSGLDDEIKTAYMFDDNTLSDRIIKLGETWGITIDRENIEIERGERDISVTVKYHAEVDFIDGYAWEHDFIIHRAGQLPMPGHGP